MESSTGKGCLYQGRHYPEGSKIRGHEQCIVCKDGSWQDLDEGFDDSEPSLAYFYH